MIEWKVVPEQVVVNKHKELVRRTCDVCKTVSCEDKEDWGNSVETIKTSLFIERRQNFIDCGNISVKNIDICPNCFEKHLIPFFRTLNVEFNEDEWDW